MMATITGNNGVITIGGTAVLAVRSYTVDTTADTIETTTMGVDTRQYLKGLSSWSGSADVYVDLANLPGGASAIGDLIATGGTVGSGTTNVVFALNSSSAGTTLLNKLSGACIVTGFSVNSSMDGMVEGTISFQGSGALLYSAT
jgi:hypothetical protein